MKCTRNCLMNTICLDSADILAVLGGMKFAGACSMESAIP